MKVLSSIDKEMLKILLREHGKLSSKTIAEKLEVPLSTIQRRRMRLEKELLDEWRTLDIKKFGWRAVDLLIATTGGLTNRVGEQLLKRSETILAVRTIGEHTIDLKVEIAIKDNSELLDILEEVKAMDGVKDVIWTEAVELIGKKDMPSHIFNNHINNNKKNSKTKT